MSAAANSGDRWQDRLYDQLRAADVTIFSHVPDAGHAILIDRCGDDPDAISVPLTTEAEGIGICAGAHLGGKRAVLLQQSSGVGNCINQLSLIQHGQFPFLTYVSMRGEYGEGNPWQFAMGQAVKPTLEAMGVHVFTASTPEDITSMTEAGLTMAFQTERAVAILMSQRLLGAKKF
ncbi:MAG TPA: phosphonopyruvate decarboxylase [Hyphomicrobiaceae bacterium]|nr:phosphonopyruvate decarboxylase [Hyphomicrobiaceae bacterium]